MSLVARGPAGIWHYDFEYDGHRYRGSTKTADRQKALRVEALVKASAYRGTFERDFGLKRRRGQPSVAEFWRLVEPVIRSSYAASTPHSLVSTVSGFVRMFGTLRVGEITADEVEQFKAARLAGTVPGLSTRVCARTLQRDLAYLRMVFTHAVERGWVLRDPTRGVKLPRAQEPVYHVPTVEECQRLLSAISAPQLRDMIAVISLTGLRRSEACGMLNHYVLLGREPALLIPQRKTGRVKRIPLVRSAAEILRRNVRADEPDAPVFHRLGRAILPDSLSHAFRAAATDAGLPRVTLHKLRHALGKRLEEAGAKLGEIGEILGHAPPYTSTLIYIKHTTEKDKRLAIERAVGGLEVPSKVPTGTS
ncbi:MAG: tyrosine-type recombinase/integrase [Candidatus Rokubacteria bacterium]|nr:tyrosine-type recombinase/integrase [Candidatus Rokubacteria bacterium]